MLPLRDFLKSKGFANFTCFGDQCETFDNGKCRIEICGTVASLRTLNGNLHYLAITIPELREIVTSFFEGN